MMEGGQIEMRKVYVQPEMNETAFAVEDIVTASGAAGYDSSNSGIGADKGNQTIESGSAVVSLNSWFE